MTQHFYLRGYVNKISLKEKDGNSSCHEHGTMKKENFLCTSDKNTAMVALQIYHRKANLYELRLAIQA